MGARTASSPRSRALGLSLVEILVGVAIGLIGIVAIFQAVAVWSKHTSTTSAGGDAQVAGTLALFNIERDLKQAGHGFAKAATAVMGCNVAFTDSAPARAFNFGLRPVDIAASAGGAPDTITFCTAIRRSTSRKAPSPMRRRRPRSCGAAAASR